MKLILTKSKEYHSNEYVNLQELNLIDVFCDDAEAVEIIVDDFLSSECTYEELGPTLEKICSKLRLNGKITIIDKDIELLNHSLTLGRTDLDSYNNILFGAGPIKSVYNIDIICDLLKSMSIKVTQKIIEPNCSIIVEGIRC